MSNESTVDSSFDSPDNSNVLAQLTEEWLSGQLDEKAALRYAELLEQSPEQCRLFRENVSMDFLLYRLYSPQNQKEAFFRDSKTNSQYMDHTQIEWPEIHDPQLHSVLVCENPADVSTHCSFYRMGPDGKIHYKESRWFYLYQFIREMSDTTLVRRVLPIMLICLISTFVLYHYFDFTEYFQEGNEIRTIATITETISPEWLPESVTYKRQQKIGPGRIAFQSGTVQLKMDNGVALILEGPCDFILYETGKSFCNYGKISAHVPPSGTGFEITSPQGKVVDRGTDFFLNVTKHESLLEVIQGKVELDSMAGKPQTLTTGKAMTFQKNESARTRSFGGKSYVTSDRFLSQLTDYVSSLLEKKTALDSVLDETPNLLIRFDLQKRQSDSLPNLSRIGKQQCKSATIEGCQNSEGALYGTQGIGFAQMSDRIVFSPNQTVSSMTMVASVRINNRLQFGNVLCSSKPRSEDPGTILWQISNLGFMQIQISPRSNGDRPCYNSSEFLFPGTQETWYTLAVVLDARRKNISFYSDGKRISSVPWNNPIPIQLKKMTLGNVLYNTMETERQLNGAMDRFYIFNRALTKEEIGELVW